MKDSVYDEFAAILESKVAALKQGSGLEPGVTCGPLISPAGVSKVMKIRWLLTITRCLIVIVSTIDSSTMPLNDDALLLLDLAVEFP